MDNSSNLALVRGFSAFGEAFVRDTGSATKTDPKAKFINACRNDIEALEANEEFGKMFTKRKNGGYVVTLRNGVKKLEVVPGKPDFRVENTDKAMGLLNAAIASCEKGELDEIFAAQAKRKLAD